VQSLWGQEASAAAYTFMFLHLNAEQNQDIKTAIHNFNICRSSNLAATVTNKNYIHKEESAD
jgi:hypothetical protein